MLPALANNLKRSLIIMLGTVLLTGLLHQTGVLQKLEWISYDWRLKTVRQDKPAPDDIAVVLIDDTSLQALSPILGRWPWPRSIYADVLDFFALANPRAVLFDITFTEKSLDQRGPDGIGPDDAALVAASAEYPFTYHAARLVLDTSEDDNRQLLNRPLPDYFVRNFAAGDRYGAAMPGFVSGLDIPSNNSYYLPFEELSQAAANIGIVEFNSDSDGIYRRTRLLHRYQDNYFPALSIAPILNQQPPHYIRQKNGQLDFASFNVPVDRDGHYLVNPYGSFSTYSISGILASQKNIQEGKLDELIVSPYEFENKLVYIGASAAGLLDLKSTPIDGRLPGVMLHASIAGNLLQRDFLRQAPTWLSIVLVILFTVLTTSVVLGSKNIFFQNTIPLFLGAGFTGLALQQMGNNIVIELMPPLMSIALSWTASFSSLVLIEGREKRRFKRMMSQYLSPAVLATVADKHEEIARAEVGSKENITILFSDIRGFTNMSEKMQPEEVVRILNHYFSEMNDAIFSHEGNIDKFIGDAIMAYWGAPIKTDNHADKATITALEMMQRLQRVKAWLREHQYPDLNIGIGLHTGDAILGNIGSESKLDYTIIGDNVNLASRMEGLTKPYGSSVLITESTRDSLQTDIPCRLIDLVRVKGKELPIRIYQPLLNPETAFSSEYDEARRIQSLSQQAFDYYLAQQWEDAISVLDTLPDDEPSRILRQRCQEYQQTPPAADWDGVYTMTTK